MAPQIGADGQAILTHQANVQNHGACRTHGQVTIQVLGRSVGRDAEPVMPQDETEFIAEDVLVFDNDDFSTCAVCWHHKKRG